MTIYLRERYNGITLLSFGIGVFTTSLTGLLLASLYPDWALWQYLIRIVPMFFLASSFTFVYEVRKLQDEFGTGDIVERAKVAVSDGTQQIFAFDEQGIPYNTSGALHSILSRDPQKQQASPEALTRKLVGKLLRDTLRVEKDKSNNRIAGWRMLSDSGYKWYPATWGVARNALSGYIYTVSGRNGGTFCGDKYPTVFELYDAWGRGNLDLKVK